MFKEGVKQGARVSASIPKAAEVEERRPKWIKKYGDLGDIEDDFPTQSKVTKTNNDATMLVLGQSDCHPVLSEVRRAASRNNVASYADRCGDGCVCPGNGAAPSRTESVRVRHSPTNLDGSGEQRGDGCNG